MCEREALQTGVTSTDIPPSLPSKSSSSTSSSSTSSSLTSSSTSTSSRSPSSEQHKQQQTGVPLPMIYFSSKSFHQCAHSVVFESSPCPLSAVSFPTHTELNLLDPALQLFPTHTYDSCTVIQFKQYTPFVGEFHAGPRRNQFTPNAEESRGLLPTTVTHMVDDGSVKSGDVLINTHGCFVACRLGVHGEHLRYFNNLLDPFLLTVPLEASRRIVSVVEAYLSFLTRHPDLKTKRVLILVDPNHPAVARHFSGMVSAERFLFPKKIGQISISEMNGRHLTKFKWLEKM